MRMILQMFSFAGRLGQTDFFRQAGVYAAVFAALYGIQRSEILSPGIARGSELIIFALVLLSVPLLALMTRRLADTPFPGWLILAVPCLFGLASASAVMFGWPLGQTIFTWAGYGSIAALILGLLWPGQTKGVAA